MRPPYIDPELGSAMRRVRDHAQRQLTALLNESPLDVTSILEHIELFKETECLHEIYVEDAIELAESKVARELRHMATEAKVDLALLIRSVADQLEAKRNATTSKRQATRNGPKARKRRRFVQEGIR